MRQVVFVAPGELEWRETADPVICGADEAIVRPTVLGRCDLDTHYFAGRMPLAAGSPIGHEIIGDIVDLGDDACEAWLDPALYVAVTN